MLKKCFSVASVVSFGGALLWGSMAGGCSSSDAITPPADAGADTGDNSSSSSSSSGSAGDSGLSGIDAAGVPGVTVTYGTCPAFTKCDGPVAGNFSVTGGCLSDTTFDQYKTLCAGLNVHDVILKASGTIQADTQNITRALSSFVGATIDIDKANCSALSIAGGSAAPCSAIGALLTTGVVQGPKFDSAQCVDGTAPNTCTCQASATVTDNSQDTYTTDGTGTMTSTGPAATRTFNYCGSPAAAPTTITYQETTKNNPTFGMFLDFTKQ